MRRFDVREKWTRELKQVIRWLNNVLTVNSTVSVSSPRVFECDVGLIGSPIRTRGPLLTGRPLFVYPSTLQTPIRFPVRTSRPRLRMIRWSTPIAVAERKAFTDRSTRVTGIPRR
eukprot:5978993-Pyramimonas_sp.AAC.1